MTEVISIPPTLALEHLGLGTPPSLPSALASAVPTLCTRTGGAGGEEESVGGDKFVTLCYSLGFAGV